MPQTKYRPRFGPDKKNKDDVTIRATDRAGIAALALYPFLPVNWLAPHFGLTLGSMESRVTELKNAGYIKVCDAQQEHRNYNEPLLYEIDLYGETLLADAGLPTTTDEFTGPTLHRSMSAKVASSVLFGTTDQFIVEKITDAPHLGFIFKDKKITVRPDTFPLKIDHGEVRYFILGIEVDNGTESIRSYDYTRSHISTKFGHYARYLEDRLYKKHLGFPDCIIPFTTTSPARMQTMQRLWLEFTEDHKHLRDKIIFKVFKDEPTGWVLSDPWQFADGELLFLNQPGEEVNSSGR